MKLKEGSLFSGYNGLGLGLGQVLDTELAWVSDIDKGACKILAHHYPDVPNIGDLTAVDWTAVEPVDIITGGFPCQDLSHAGKRAGMTADSRSGLWSYMHDAIRIIRPRLVVAENVRGLLSAEALRPVESCTFCLGDGSDFDLRALGSVLADLADIGYDAQWCGLRAADVGACHGRFRVFLIAYPQDSDRIGESARASASVFESRPRSALRPDRSDRSLETGGAVTLLPTPAVNDMGKAYTPDEWDAWTAKMKAAHGNGNGHGKSLEIEAARLLPTPTAADSNASGGSTPSDVTLTDAVVRTNLGDQENPRHAIPTEGRSTEVLRDVRGGDVPQEVRGATGRSDTLPEQAELLEVMCSNEGRGGALGTPSAGQEAPEADVREVRDGQEVARSSRRQELGERPAGESHDPLCDLPPETALAGGSATSPHCCEASRRNGSCPWAAYSAAIHRWEICLGRSAPPATEPTGKAGAHRLSPKFTEWLMGLPAGWITDVPGITRNEALKACGNGVVPQQALAAITHMLAAIEVAA